MNSIFDRKKVADVRKIFIKSVFFDIASLGSVSIDLGGVMARLLQQQQVKKKRLASFYGGEAFLRNMNKPFRCISKISDRVLKAGYSPKG